MTFDLYGRIKTPLKNLGLSAPAYLPNISSIGLSTTKRIAGQTHQEIYRSPFFSSIDKHDAQVVYWESDSSKF